jgi:predicted  nucleic acid-binding Zn-ribbon protein
MRDEAKKLKAAITAAEAKRAIQATVLTPANLRMYESLRTRRGGSAVVRLTGALCGGCRVAIPDGLRRNVAAAPNLVQCPNCERILALG